MKRKASTVSFACPSCGTDYARKLARLDTLPAKVRCHRCGTVWQPVPPHAEAPEPTPVRTPAPRPEPEVRRERQPRPAPPKPPRSAPSDARKLLVGGLWAVALLLLVGGMASFGYAYRDHIPLLAGSAPVLAEVHPAWTEVDGGLRLAVSARAVNEGRRDVAVDRVRVKFLSRQGAWIGEVMVRVGRVPIPAGGDVGLDFAVDEVPDGTASLEFVLLPSADPGP